MRTILVMVMLSSGTLLAGEPDQTVEKFLKQFESELEQADKAIQLKAGEVRDFAQRALEERAKKELERVKAQTPGFEYSFPQKGPDFLANLWEQAKARPAFAGAVICIVLAALILLFRPRKPASHP